MKLLSSPSIDQLLAAFDELLYTDWVAQLSWWEEESDIPPTSQLVLNVEDLTLDSEVGWERDVFSWELTVFDNYKLDDCFDFIVKVYYSKSERWKKIWNRVYQYAQEQLRKQRKG